MTRAAITTAARFPFDVLRATGPVLVNFHADWCRSCRVLDPVLDELARDWAGRLEVVKLDVEKHPTTADRYGVQSIPTLVLFVNGEEQLRLVNVVRRQAIEEHLYTALA
jgi:thioredoxin 1